MKKRNPFYFKQFVIHQEDSAMPVSQDACTFGAMVCTIDKKSALDIGTGTGLLTLILCQQNPRLQVYSIEKVDSEFFNASYNISNSLFASKINLIHGNIFETSFPILFDLVVCNPPFFIQHKKSNNLKYNTARHLEENSYEKWLTKASSLVALEGVMYFLIPTIHQNEITNWISKFPDFKVLEWVFIHDNPNKASHVCIVLIGKNKTSNTMERVFYYKTSDGELTNELKSLMAPYYVSL